MKNCNFLHLRNNLLNRQTSCLIHGTIQPRSKDYASVSNTKFFQTKVHNLHGIFLYLHQTLPFVFTWNIIFKMEDSWHNSRRMKQFLVLCRQHVFRAVYRPQLNSFCKTSNFSFKFESVLFISEQSGGLVSPPLVLDWSLWGGLGEFGSPTKLKFSPFVWCLCINGALAL